MRTHRQLLLVLAALLAAAGCVDRDRPVQPEPVNWHHPTSAREAPLAATPPPEPALAGATWYKPRSSWAVQEVLVARTTPMGGIPTRITVHHSNFPGDTTGWAPDVLRRIEVAHRRSIGRDGLPGACIAYHFLIAPDGTVYEGRPLKYQGAHAGGDNNAQNIGVCLLGNFQERQVPTAQAQSLTRVLDRLRADYRIPRQRVYGHLDFNPPGTHHTDCPGVNLYRLVKAYRSGP